MILGMALTKSDEAGGFARGDLVSWKGRTGAFQVQSITSNGEGSVEWVDLFGPVGSAQAAFRAAMPKKLKVTSRATRVATPAAPAPKKGARRVRH